MGKDELVKSKLHKMNILHLILLCGDIETNPGPNTHDLWIMHANVRSLRNKLDIIEAEYNKFDIITFSETWLPIENTTRPTSETRLSSEGTNKSFLLPNYHSPIRKDRPNGSYGGVAVYIKNYLVCIPRNDLEIDGLEAVWVETKLDQKSLLIGCFYRPPGSNVHYWDLINDSIRKANDANVQFIILGDFNVDYLNNPSHHLTDIMNLYQLHQLIDKPTRITDTTETCLDLILTQSPNIIVSSDVMPPVCSDHSVPCARVKNSERNLPHSNALFTIIIILIKKHFAQSCLMLIGET